MTDESTKRLELALLTIAEAVKDVATHAGYSGCKRLADEVQSILVGGAPAEAPAQIADVVTTEEDD